MVTELKVTRQREGNHPPLSVRIFILEHLAAVGEDYGAMHRLYKLVASTGPISLQGIQASLERGGNNIVLPVTDVIGGELDA